jgi:hypothetical protein
MIFNEGTEILDHTVNHLREMNGLLRSLPLTNRCTWLDS